MALDFDTSGRLGLRKATSDTTVDEFGPAMAALGEDVEDQVVVYGSDPLASRPVSTAEHPGITGRLYYATDARILFYDTGTGWLPNSLQPGDLIFTARGEATREGCLKCEGQEYSPVTYPALAAAIGDTFGGSSAKPLLPDFRERVPMGVGASEALGAKPGVATVTLTEAQMPVHTHKPLTAGATFHTGNAGGVSLQTPGSYDSNDDATTGEAGGGEAHTNIQPSTVCRVWIRT